MKWRQRKRKRSSTTPRQPPGNSINATTRTTQSDERVKQAQLAHAPRAPTTDPAATSQTTQQPANPRAQLIAQRNVAQSQARALKDAVLAENNVQQKQALSAKLSSKVRKIENINQQLAQLKQHAGNAPTMQARALPTQNHQQRPPAMQNKIASQDPYALLEKHMLRCLDKISSNPKERLAVFQIAKNAARATGQQSPDVVAYVTSTLRSNDPQKNTKMQAFKGLVDKLKVESQYGARTGNPNGKSAISRVEGILEADVAVAEVQQARRAQPGG